MARIDQILIDRAWVYPKQPDILHYVIKDIDDEESHLVTPRKSKLGQKLEKEVAKLGKNIEAPNSSEDEEGPATSGNHSARCDSYAYPKLSHPIGGVCDTPLDPEGHCPNAHRHIDLRAEVD